MDLCNECGGKIINNSFERICGNCGLVYNRNFQETSYILTEKKFKGNLGKQFVALGKRADFVGALGSFIDFENSKYLKDKSGKLLKPDNQRLFRRLKKNYSQFLRIKNHETEYRIFNILNKISNYLNLSKTTRNNAAYFYKCIIKKEKKVINNISLIAFCIFYAARKENHNAPITIKEISKAFQNYGHRVNPRLILRDGLEYKKYLKIENSPHKSEDYLNRLVNETVNYKFMDERLKKKGSSWNKKEFHILLLKKSHYLLKKLPEWKRGGRNPFILTAAIIYLADKLLAKEFNKKSILTQKIISQTTKVAEYSIRDHYVNLLKPIFIKNR